MGMGVELWLPFQLSFKTVRFVFPSFFLSNLLAYIHTLPHTCLHSLIASGKKTQHLHVPCFSNKGSTVVWKELGPSPAKVAHRQPVDDEELELEEDSDDVREKENEESQ